ncbi:MAG: VWA domain-containing protein [Pyrinomonadaceae bacterium]
MKSFFPASLLSALTFVIALSANAFAQTPTPKPTPHINDDEGVIKVSSRLVVVPVSVTDANGVAVQGLTANDFRIAEEGRAQKIENVGNAEEVPLEIALLFDISASTDAMFKFEQETAAKFLQDVLRAKDRASVFTVGEKATLIQSRDTAEKSIVSIRAIQPTKQQTAFYDSLRAAAEHLRRSAPEGSRRVIVIISDGEDTNSEGVLRAIWDAERKIADNVQGEKLRELRVRARDAAKTAEQAKVLKALQDADTVFYSINPAGSSYQLNKMSAFGQENMQKFADQTGGTAFLPKFLPIDTKDEYANANNMKRNQATLEQIFRQLANELRAQYLVQYYSETEFPQGKFVKLDVGLTNPTGRKLRARQGYYAK